MAAPLSTWSRLDAADRDAVALVRETLEEYPTCPGAAGFAVRVDTEERVYLTPPAAALLGAKGFPVDRLAASPPPRDSPYLRLIGGDRRAWTSVIPSNASANAAD